MRNRQCMFDKDGEPITEKQEITVRAFKAEKTFDISQTDGKEVPTLGPSELVGSIEGYPKLIEALKEISPVPITSKSKTSVKSKLKESKSKTTKEAPKKIKEPKKDEVCV